MLKIKPVIFVLFTALALAACKPEKEAKTKKQWALEQVDTLYLDTKNSGLDIDRWRVFTNKHEMLKIGKMGIHFTVNDLSLHVTAHYKIDSGFVIYDKKIFRASCFLNTNQIITPVLDSTKKLSLGTPGYILNTRSKFIRFDFSGNFYPKEQKPTTGIFLTLADSTGAITNHETDVQLAYAAKGEIKKIISAFYLNGLQWNLFEKENKNEIIKDSIVGKLDLKFKF
jgi:hypothetical protein